MGLFKFGSYLSTSGFIGHRPRSVRREIGVGIQRLEAQLRVRRAQYVRLRARGRVRMGWGMFRIAEADADERGADLAGDFMRGLAPHAGLEEDRRP